jgi:serine protease Do
MAQTVMHGLIEKGHVDRGWLGALIQDLNQDLSNSFGYKGTEGVLLGDVLDDGPAAEAGLKAGDVIVKYDGMKMEDSNQLRHTVASTSPGSDVPVVVFRDGKEQTFTVHIKQMENASQVARVGGESSADLGLSVQTLTPELGKELGYEAREQGVVVVQVEPGSVAASLDIQPRDLIVTVGDEPIHNTSDFRKALSDKDLSKGIRMQVKRDGVRRYVFAKVTG